MRFPFSWTVTLYLRAGPEIWTSGKEIWLKGSGVEGVSGLQGKLVEINLWIETQQKRAQGI